MPQNRVGTEGIGTDGPKGPTAGAPNPRARCHDCGRAYGDEHGFPDMIIPTSVWRQISPSGDDGGLLCPSCICGRLHNAGIREVESAFFSGSIQSVTRPTMYALRRLENLQERLERELFSKVASVSNRSRA